MRKRPPKKRRPGIRTRSKKQTFFDAQEESHFYDPQESNEELEFEKVSKQMLKQRCTDELDERARKAHEKEIIQSSQS